MGTGLHDRGVEMSEDEVARLLAGPEPGPESPESDAPEVAHFDAPKVEGNFDFPEFAQFDAPRGKKGKSLGPDDKSELQEFFTQDGIGQIVARGFDAFFVACGADKMGQAESNNMAKVVAYYCRARLPSGAGAYQPELLLLATVGMAVLPRLGPIAEKTEPTRARFGEWIRGVFKRKE